MKAYRRNRRKEGSALLVVIVLAAILAITVWSALNRSVTELRQTYSSMAWTRALHTAEAGVAVAFDEYRKSTIRSNTAWSAWTTGASNALVLAYTSLAPTGHDAEPSEYTVEVNTNTFMITSTGRLPGIGSGATVSRTIQVKLDPTFKKPFTRGMLVQDSISISGGLSLDSFDSSDTNKSTNGQFDPAKASTNCSIAALGTGVSITGNGSGELNGDAATAPGGTVSTSGGFAITGAVTNNADDEIDPAYVPVSTALTDPSINNSITINVAGSTDMAIPSINLNATKALTVTGYGLLRLYVDGTINFTGQAELRIIPSPANTNLAVEIYANGDVDIGGGGAVNQTADAASLQIIGTPNCSSVRYSGNSEFVGVINTPSAEVTLTGASGFVGAVIGKEVTLSGNTHFYFDEALAKLKSNRITKYDKELWVEQ